MSAAADPAASASRLVFVILRSCSRRPLFTHLRIDGVAPEVGLVCVLAVAYEDGADTGAIFGFLMGLSMDLFLTTPLGLSAMSYAITGYGVGVFQAGIVRTTPWLAPILGGIGGLVGGLVFIGGRCPGGRERRSCRSRASRRC